MKEFIDIYYADDDADDRDFFLQAIKEIEQSYTGKINLHLFEDGESLLKNLPDAKSQNGIVFLDINLTGKSGYDVLKEIRKSSINKKLPVIMYSTSSNVNSINTSRLLGANLYVIKPNYFKEISEIILKIIVIDWATFETNNTNFILTIHNEGLSCRIQ